MLVELDGRPTLTHLPNSGRLRELLHPDNTMLVSRAQGTARRKTMYDLVLVKMGGVLISADAWLPNALLEEAISVGALSEFTGYNKISREVPFHRSRLDLMLSGDKGICYIEAKSVTLVEQGVGLFPDSPTERGRKHMACLAEAVALGHRAAAVFVIQRGDADALEPNEGADPEFCRALGDAMRRGVEAYAYRCEVTRQKILISGPVPVLF